MRQAFLKQLGKTIIKVTLRNHPQLDKVPFHAPLPAWVSDVHELELQVSVVLEIEGSDIDDVPTASVLADLSALQNAVLESSAGDLLPVLRGQLLRDDG